MIKINKIKRVKGSSIGKSKKRKGASAGTIITLYGLPNPIIKYGIPSVKYAPPRMMYAPPGLIVKKQAQIKIKKKGLMHHK